jgi:uncharacterized protein (TIGR00251 family)
MPAEQAAARRDGEDLLLSIRVKPGARSDAIVGLEADCIRIAIAAAPERGRATARLLAFLADACGVPARNVELLSGAFAPRKRVRIIAPRRIPDAFGPLGKPEAPCD